MVALRCAFQWMRVFVCGRPETAATPSSGSGPYRTTEAEHDVENPCQAGGCMQLYPSVCACVRITCLCVGVAARVCARVCGG